MKRAVIHCSAADLQGNERNYINDCLDRSWLTQGKYVKKFEEQFAEQAGTKYAVACSSGTSALHLALLALGVGPKDAVIVPSLTYVATANAVRYCGAKVIIVDIDADSWCANVDGLSTRFESVYMLPVHVYDSLALIDESNVRNVIIEDSCHVPNKPLEGVVAAHSFYASKIIACGEGGMVTTNDAGLDNLLRLYRGQGATIPGRYHHSVIGYNYRMTDLQAAIGLAQLERLPEILAKRRAVINRYRSNLSSTPITLQGGERASGWATAVTLPANVSRDSVAENMAANQVETRPFFEPLHTLPMYQRLSGKCPIAEDISSRGIVLPTHTLLTNEDIDYVCEKLLEAVAMYQQ